MEKMGTGSNVSWLTTVPAGDMNFKSHLRTAADSEIREALSIMEGKRGNATRVAACERELRKRGKGKQAVGTGRAGGRENEGRADRR